MNFEKIEQAYSLLLENVQELQNTLLTNFYDALVEQNGVYLDGNTELDIVKKNNETLKSLKLDKEEWRRAYQFLLMKAAQTEPLQANHQFTPDSIGFIVTFLIDQLSNKEHIDVLEIGSGMGNLAETILNNTNKNVDYLGLELDDLLIDISASIADVMDAKVSFVQGDAVRPQVLKESDVIISDLPVGFYPDDNIATRYEVASRQEHTYAHHLLMEQSLKYLKSDGYAIFLAPNDLLTSTQSDLLKNWLQNHAQIVAMIALPESLFGNAAYAKTIFVLKKQDEQAVQPFVYALSDLQNQADLLTFSEKFQNWSQESEI
ncbi:class I SAM-dependent methyltransferase [Streptococcus constellatus subsp. pharyngis]|uniref:Adenine-specific DNA methylase n=1 Tax=Streptococcus constellatus subsp. pharyngis SK1060 = CCUG 46377 TaxID=1035184 RepID=U2XY22_STRCV|nr:class I SAM-dependent methyltransferase [Streptococcus constellatus]AGU73476.1 adenine-specific DNA methylase [Streptococcus constellatus subsp. pharyngis C232]AGU75230.1 adenine-specific DNA methylase [Streptococcus constellatus subsp. pharyngis C818]AGU80621.1 adenine-specific DNA methylase [Streptococcus constellatus subsp. pharyngis C1050]QRP81145.1 class I SAM-dependent methyltransferase [Streptococcus constellatus]GAD44916.1 adenine-specific DNA methylase [Streptococcus constellatus s